MPSGETGQPERGHLSDYAAGSKDPVSAKESTSAAQSATLTRRPVVVEGGTPGGSGRSVPPRSAPARGLPSTPSSSSPAEGGGARGPTLTQRIRSVQPPDVARQAMSELGVLAHELDTLPGLLESAGLVHSHQRTYFEASDAYLTLAQQAWMSVAEERLEQSGAEPEYRQHAIGVARRITQLQNEAQRATGNLAFSLPRKTTLLWRRRTRLLSDGLQAWQDRLGAPPSTTEMGNGLFLLRGYAGLAVAGSLWLGLLDILVGATVATLSLFGIGLIALLAAAVISGSATSVATLVIGTVATALVWTLVVLLAVNGPLPLGLVLGASVFSPSHTTRNGASGSPVVAVALKIWWLVIGLLSIPALLGALVLGSVIVRKYVSIAPPDSPQEGLLLAGSVLTWGVAAAVIACLTLLLLLALPTFFIVSIRSVFEMAGSPSWVPQARYYAVQPAGVALTILTTALVIATWGATSLLGLQNVPLVTLPLGSPLISISLRSIALVLALFLPFILLLELPFRQGMRKWQKAWLGDLASRRADVESHIRRLSVVDPRIGAQDTSEENLRAMQYDLILLQFYQGKIDEAMKARRTPESLRAAGAALLTLVVASLVLDVGAAALAHLFPLIGG